MQSSPLGLGSRCDDPGSLWFFVRGRSAGRGQTSLQSASNARNLATRPMRRKARGRWSAGAAWNRPTRPS